MAQGSAELEGRLADLAAASANFGFLLPHEPLLLFYGAAAETRESIDPSASLTAAHEFGEVFTVTLGRLFGVTVSQEDPQAYLHRLHASGPVTGRVLAALEELNALPYDPVGSQGNSIAAYFVARCFELAVWLFRFRTGDREPIPYVPADSAKLHTLRERVAAVKKALPQLRRDFESRTPGRSQAAAAVEGLLAAAGWTFPESNRDAKAHHSLGTVANLRSTNEHRLDYLLLVGGQAAGLVVCLEDGSNPDAAMQQAEERAKRFSDAPFFPTGRAPFPYRYMSDGRQLHFRNENDPEPRSRTVSGFHQPSTLARWSREAEADPNAPTYSARLAHRLPELEQPAKGSAAKALKAPQAAAIGAIEKAMASGRRRAMVQMVIGSGKTYTEILTAFRQLEYAKAHRILFVVDRAVLAMQLIDGLHQFHIPGQVRSFTELYSVQRLTTPAALSPSARVVVTTVHTLRSILRQSETSSSEVDHNPDLPPDAFDLIIVDDCRRSFYDADRARLEYFDARLLGFTSLPDSWTIRFFEGHPVSEYTLNQAVADGSALDYSLFQARLDSPERAVLVPLDGDAAHPDRGADRPGSMAGRVVEPPALTAVLHTFRDSLATLFPGRGDLPGAVPKTLVLAHDDHHAEQVAKAIRAVFAAGPGFVRHIDGTAAEPLRRLREFTTAPEFRIAVIRTSMATGFDVPALECMLILSDVRSAAEYVQLLGRGTRPISAAALRAVSPGAIAKTHFVVIDAVGASRHEPRGRVNVVDPPGAASTTALSHLLDIAAQESLTQDDRTELGLRLARLVPLLTDGDDAAFRSLAGIRLEDLVQQLVEIPEPGNPTVERRKAPGLADALSRLPALRETLLDLQDRMAGPDLQSSAHSTPTARPSEASADRLAGALENRLGRLTAAQTWWIGHIADSAVASAQFDPTDLEGLPFSGRGGTDGFLREFGNEGALDLLRELDQELG
ncbi:type I restriction enzyme R subunit [Catenulispora sp. GP43]|uniref:DEAD/DEAH box helicase family protein n=1 Tax=Catenulispora sp. GP43 TaxID=3156263 RepID=UPI0035166C0A